jgi:hypothetical protein
MRSLAGLPANGKNKKKKGGKPTKLQKLSQAQRAQWSAPPHDKSNSYNGAARAKQQQQQQQQQPPARLKPLEDHKPRPVLEGAGTGVPKVRAESCI